LADHNLVGRIIYKKLFTEKKDGRMWIELNWLQIASYVNSPEHYDET
jgi:hypothetical protein